MEIIENFCKRFRQYLLDRFTGKTPGGYYARFKWVVKAAASDGYFGMNPTAHVSAKCNPSKKLKENLEASEYLLLLRMLCVNDDIKSAFLFSLYTGLRWVDVKKLEWKDINYSVLTTRIIQAETGSSAHVFCLPTADGSNKTLGRWIKSAGIDKEIT